MLTHKLDGAKIMDIICRPILKVSEKALMVTLKSKMKHWGDLKLTNNTILNSICSSNYFLFIYIFYNSTLNFKKCR